MNGGCVDRVVLAADASSAFLNLLINTNTYPRGQGIAGNSTSKNTTNLASIDMHTDIYLQYNECLKLTWIKQREIIHI